MEKLSGELNDQETNYLCLICGGGGCAADSDNAIGKEAGISKQLTVIFILRNVLQLPNNQLHEYLKKYGNPENWVSLCDPCTKITGEARRLHLQIVGIAKQLKDHQKLIVEKVKSSSDTPPEDGRSRGSDIASPKIREVWKDTRNFVQNYKYDDLFRDDPFLEADKLIQKLETFPQIKIEPLEVIDNLKDISGNDLSPGSPNLNDNDSDWLPPTSPSPEDLKGTTDTTSSPKPPKKIRNRNRHPPIPPSEFTNQCPHCPLKFRFYAQVFSHMQSTHAISDYPCLHPNCSKVLATIKKYSKHRVRYHLKPRPDPKARIKNLMKSPPAPRPVEEGPQPRVICDICGGDFASQNNLKQHIKFVHEKSKVYKKFDVSCHLCGVIVKNVNMRMHLLRLHKDQEEVLERKVKGQEGPREPVSLFKCPVMGCRVEYLRRDGLDKHMIRCHGGVGGGEGDDGGDPGNVKFFRFNCAFCGKGFSWRRKLNQHEMVHRNNQLNVKPFKCDLCEKAFSTKRYLSYHRHNTHKLGKRFRVAGEGNGEDGVVKLNEKLARIKCLKINTYKKKLLNRNI